MTRKELEKILNYLPVLYLVNSDSKITIETITNTRIFFEYLANTIGLNRIPNPEDISVDYEGKINIEWIKDIRLENYLEIKISGNETIEYYFKTKEKEVNNIVLLTSDLNKKLISYILNFK